MKIPREIASKANDIAGRGRVVRQVADWAFEGTERFLAITGEPGSGKTGSPELGRCPTAPVTVLR